MLLFQARLRPRLFFLTLWVFIEKHSKTIMLVLCVVFMYCCSIVLTATQSSKKFCVEVDAKIHKKPGIYYIDSKLKLDDCREYFAHFNF